MGQSYVGCIIHEEQSEKGEGGGKKDKMERRLTCVKKRMWGKTEGGMRENNRKKAEKGLKSNF